MSAPGCTATLGAKSTTSPVRASTRPKASTAAPPSNCRRPAKASASVICMAAAVKRAVSTTAPAPTAMPDGLTSTRCPLEPRLPMMADGLGAVTRLMLVLLAPGCWK